MLPRRNGFRACWLLAGDEEMCLAIPGQIIQITDGESRLAVVNVSGVTRTISLRLVPEAKEGDWVLVHVGFALQVLDERAAEETLKVLSQIQPTDAVFGGRDVNQ